MKSDRKGDGACWGVPRRAFLADCGMGFTGLALGAMLHRDGIARAAEREAWAPPDGKPHFAPKAKNVIWLFMVGGASHVEGFDPKPALNLYSGKSIAETPHKDVVNSPFVKQNVREIVPGQHKIQPKLYPLQTGYLKCGQSGIQVRES